CVGRQPETVVLPKQGVAPKERLYLTVARKRKRRLLADALGGKPGVTGSWGTVIAGQAAGAGEGMKLFREGSRSPDARRQDMAVTSLPERKSWQALKRHHQEIAGQHLRELFASDPGRGERLTDETMRLLVALAEESGVPEKRDAMFRGEHINVSEDRPVLHVALRMPEGQSLVVDGTDVVAQVHAVLRRMADF